MQGFADTLQFLGYVKFLLPFLTGVVQVVPRENDEELFSNHWVVNWFHCFEAVAQLPERMGELEGILLEIPFEQFLEALGQVHPNLKPF